MSESSNLPNLDTVVLEALKLFQKTPLSEFPRFDFRNLLVVGSGNAYWVGRIMFKESSALFADESEFEETLAHNPDIDGIIIISASGGKSSVKITQTSLAKGLPTKLLTNNPTSPTAKLLEAESVYTFPKNPEPYSYNVSSYLGMLLSHSGEQVEKIEEALNTLKGNLPHNLGEIKAFVFILPDDLGLLKNVFVTKFEELFGSKVTARAYTSEEFKHAKTIVEDKDELFVSFGETSFDLKTSSYVYNLPLPKDASYPLAFVLGYFFIGRVQASHPPYYQDNIEAYLKKVKEWFGEELKLIS